VGGDRRPNSTPERRVLTVRFVRTLGQPDRVYVRRSDGSEASWSFPSFGNGPPHDLVHLVVESHVGLRAGFWGRVDAGADPARINAEANRKGGANKYAGFGDDLRELYLAEAVTNVMWGVPGIEAVDRVAIAKANCERAGIELPPAIGEATFRLLAVEVAAASDAWRALGTAGTLECTFAPGTAPSN